MAQPPQRPSPCDATQKVATDPAHLTVQSLTHSHRQPTSVRRSWPSPHQTMTGNCAPDARQANRARCENFEASAIRHRFVHRRLVGLAPGDFLLFKQSALRGVSSALTKTTALAKMQIASSGRLCLSAFSGSLPATTYALNSFQKERASLV